MRAGMKSEARNPKSERSPKSEIRNGIRQRVESSFRISAFGFLSDFGFRISDLATVCLLTTALLTGCATRSPRPTTLKDAYAHKFYMGVAVNQDQFTEKDQRGAAIVAKHFNSISPENVLKWESVHPQPDKYDFSGADRYVEFGE